MVWAGAARVGVQVVQGVGVVQVRVLVAVVGVAAIARGLAPVERVRGERSALGVSQDPSDENGMARPLDGGRKGNKLTEEEKLARCLTGWSRQGTPSHAQTCITRRSKPLTPDPSP